MAENVTPVVLKVKDFAEREVMLVDYKFNQATDTEGQVAGIVRGGQITIFKEYWADGEEHYEEVTISCQKLENGPVGYENPWK